MVVGRLAITCPNGFVDGGGDIISSSEQLSDSQSLMSWASFAHASSLNDEDGESSDGTFALFVFLELATLGCTRAYCATGWVASCLVGGIVGGAF